MALNVGEHFKQRWLTIPEPVRQTYQDELQLICTLLEPDTQIQKWLPQEMLLQQRNRQITEHSYALLKQDILAEQARQAEQRKRERQLALEEKIAQQRADAAALLAAQETEERLKEQQQTVYLQKLAQQMQQDSEQQTYNKIAKFDVSKAKSFSVLSSQASTSSNPIIEPTDRTELQDLRVRLELEVEYYIEQTLQQLKLKLQAAAQEEIELLMSQQNTAL